MIRGIVQDHREPGPHDRDMEPLPPIIERNAAPDLTSDDAELAINEAITLVRRWLDRAKTLETRRSRQTMQRLHGVVANEAGVD